MIRCQPEKAVNQVKAMTVLHNFLRSANDMSYTPPGLADVVNPDGSITEGFWRRSSNQLTSGTHRNRSRTTDAGDVRDRLVEYFNSDRGAVAWQNTHINRR